MAGANEGRVEDRSANFAESHNWHPSYDGPRGPRRSRERHALVRFFACRPLLLHVASGSDMHYVPPLHVAPGNDMHFGLFMHLVPGHDMHIGSFLHATL